MAYEELEQFMDTKQARILEMFTVYNLLGLVVGLGLGQILSKLSGVGFLTPLCVLVGVVLTLQHRNMLVLARVWIVGWFLARRWLHQGVVTPTYRYVAPTRHAQREVVLERVINGQVVFGRRRIE
jgi:hypothetical protein